MTAQSCGCARTGGEQCPQHGRDPGAPTGPHVPGPAATDRLRRTTSDQPAEPTSR